MILIKLFKNQTLVLTCLYLIIGGCKQEDEINVPAVSTIKDEDPDCVEFVALWAAGDIAERIGKNKKWVFLNYTVDMWGDPPAINEGNVVGKLRASSYARIIEKRGDDYKVESPVNNIHGWISSEHVKAISWKNPKTKKLCK